LALPFSLIFSKAAIAWAGVFLSTGTSTSLLFPGSLHKTKLLEAILFPVLLFSFGLVLEEDFFGDGEGFGGDNGVLGFFGDGEGFGGDNGVLGFFGDGVGLGGDNGVLGFSPSVLLLFSLPFGLEGDSLGGGGGSFGAVLPPPPLPLPFGLTGKLSSDGGGGGGGSLADGDGGFLGEGPADLLSFLAK